MGALIVKVVDDPTDDTFIIWSTITSRPTHLFRTHQDLRDHLWADHERNYPNVPLVQGSPYAPDARIERALITGSSSVTGEFGYAHAHWVVPGIGGWSALRREDLLEFTCAVLTGDSEKRQKLLTLVNWR